MPEKEIEKPKKETTRPEEETKRGFKKMGALFSPEGVLMMSLAIILDGLSIVCVFLILLFGVGLLFAKIVYIFGLVTISGWAFLRSGFMPAAGNPNPRKKMIRGLTNFLKRHWKKLAGKVIPAIGDALPLWTWTVYSELTS